MKATPLKLALASVLLATTAAHAAVTKANQKEACKDFVNRIVLDYQLTTPGKRPAGEPKESPYRAARSSMGLVLVSLRTDRETLGERFPMFYEVALIATAEAIRNDERHDHFEKRLYQACMSIPIE